MEILDEAEDRLDFVAFEIAKVMKENVEENRFCSNGERRKIIWGQIFVYCTENAKGAEDEEIVDGDNFGSGNLSTHWLCIRREN